MGMRRSPTPPPSRRMARQQRSGRGGRCPALPPDPEDPLVRQNRIMSLPRDLQLIICGFLPTDNLVKTSLLIRQLNLPWADCPNLILHSDNFRSIRGFYRFVQGILVHRNRVNVNHLEFFLSSRNDPQLRRVIGYGIATHMQSLSIRIPFYVHLSQFRPPEKLWTCETLKNVSLSSTELGSFLLPNITTLVLRECQFNMATEPFASMVNLENLIISRCMIPRELTQLILFLPRLLRLEIEWASSTHNLSILMEEILLKTFTYCHAPWINFTLLNPPELDRATISRCVFYHPYMPPQTRMMHRSNLFNLLHGLQHARTLNFGFDFIRACCTIGGFPLNSPFTRLQYVVLDQRVELPSQMLAFLGVKAGQMWPKLVIRSRAEGQEDDD